jgi:L-rhamnose mutarotase
MVRGAEDPVTREWWTYTDRCQVRIVDEREPGAPWQPIDEIGHLS